MPSVGVSGDSLNFTFRVQKHNLENFSTLPGVSKEKTEHPIISLKTRD